MSRDPSLQPLRKRDAIDSERAAAGNSRVVRRLQHDTSELAHLGLEQAMRVDGFDRFECVAADELGEALRSVRGRHLHRTHLVQRYT